MWQRCFHAFQRSQHPDGERTQMTQLCTTFNTVLSVSSSKCFYSNLFFFLKISNSSFFNTIYFNTAAKWTIDNMKILKTLAFPNRKTPVIFVRILTHKVKLAKWNTFTHVRCVTSKRWKLRLCIVLKQFKMKRFYPSIICTIQFHLK